MSNISDRVWLFRLHNGMCSWHSYKDEATRFKWATKYLARGDKVSTDGFIRG